MKYLILASILWSHLVGAEVGPQPLYISHITITPEEGGCDTGEATFEFTAAGGQPAQGGLYSYFNDEIANTPQVAQKAIFKNVRTPTNLLVSDAAKTITAVLATAGASQSEEISLDIVSLPLGSGAGCITARVVKPGGLDEGSVTFDFIDVTTGDSVFKKTVTVAPFEVTAPVFASEQISLAIAIDNDCAPGIITTVDILFNFPKGISNSLKTYFFNKYCSC